MVGLTSPIETHRDVKFCMLQDLEPVKIFCQLKENFTVFNSFFPHWKFLIYPQKVHVIKKGCFLPIILSSLVPDKVIELDFHLFYAKPTVDLVSLVHKMGWVWEILSRDWFLRCEANWLAGTIFTVCVYHISLKHLARKFETSTNLQNGTRGT